MAETTDTCQIPEMVIDRVAQALRAACREEFGSDWSNDVAWRFARVAIDALESGKTSGQIPPKMVERIARAMCVTPDALVEREPPVPLDLPQGFVYSTHPDARMHAWKLRIGDARVAIEAMREPTEEMLKAGRAEAQDENAEGVWRDMVDAALGKSAHDIDAGS